MGPDNEFGRKLCAVTVDPGDLERAAPDSEICSRSSWQCT